MLGIYYAYAVFFSILSYNNFLNSLNKLHRNGEEEWVPFDTSHYCSTSAYDAASPILHEIVNSLDSLNIDVEQVNNSTYIMYASI